MVTVPEFEQQLQQRRKTIATAEKDIRGFDPRVRQTQTQLRRATPLTQVRVKLTEQKREIAKQRAFQKIAIEQKKQEGFEAKFIPVKAKFLERQEIQRDYDRALDIAESSHSGAIFALKGRRQRKFYRQIKAGMRRRTTTPTEEALGMSLPASLRFQTPTEISGGVSLPQDLRGLSSAEIRVSQSLPAVSFETSQDLPSGVDLSKVLGTRDARDVFRGLSRQPRLDQGLVKVPSFTRRETISTQPTQRFAHKIEPFKLTPRKVADIVVTGTTTLGTKLAEKAGVPTIKRDIEFKERRTFERGTAFMDPKTGKAMAPVVLDVPSYYPTVQEQIAQKSIPGSREFTILSPAKVGGVVGTATTLGLYSTPITGVPLLAGEVKSGVSEFRQKVPSVSQVISEQTPQLSVSQRIDYLKTKEGKKFEKEVVDFVGSLERQRQMGLSRAVLASTALVAPVVVGTASRTLRAAKKPFKVEFIGDSKTAFVAEATLAGDVTTGIAKRATVTPSAVAEIPTYKVWYAKATDGKVKIPKDVFKLKSETEISLQPFKIKEGKGAGVSATRRLGKDTSLTKLEQTVEFQKATDVMDLSKLSPEFRYISKGLPGGDVSGVKSFTGVGESVKGVGVSKAPKISIGKEGLIADIPVRLDRFSKTQKQLFIPTRPLPSTFTKTFTRVKPVGNLGETQVFAVQSAAKTTKALKGISKGKVIRDTGVVFIKQVPGGTSGVSFVGKGAKQLTKVKQEQLAARITTLLKAPKPIPKRLPKAKPAPVIKTRTIPISVSKQAKPFAISQQTQPVVDVETVQVRTIPGITQQSQTPLVFTKTQDRVNFLSATLTSQPTVQVTEEVTKQSLVPKILLSQPTVQIPKIKQPLREAVIPKIALATATVQKTKPKFVGPIAPKPRPQPVPIRRVPKKRGIKLPTDFLVEKKTSKTSKKKDLVTPFVRRRGEFFAIGVPTTRAKALSKGIARLRGTLAASLQLRKQSGEIIPIARETKEFRVGKAGTGTLIQRQRQRLGRMGEIKEIMAIRRAGVQRFI